MNVPVVHNKYAGTAPSGSVYIGRPSKWGNPFAMGTALGERSRVMKLFTEYLRGKPELIAAVRAELAGKDLVCFCAPQACHGDVLLRVASGGEP